MKLVIDAEDLFWFIEQYNKYYKEHNGKRYLDPGFAVWFTKTCDYERILDRWLKQFNEKTTIIIAVFAMDVD